MDCQNCGQREALIHLTEIRDGQVVNRWLCPACAREKQAARRNHDDVDGAFFGSDEGGQDPLTPPAEMTDPLAMFMGEDSLRWKNLDPDGVDTCPVCGFKLELFVRTAQLGCPGCYRAFAPNLRPLLARLHGQTIHLGKVPQTNPQGPNTLAEMTRARISLEKAVAVEDFEEAARLRDYLRQLQDLRTREAATDE